MSETWIASLILHLNFSAVLRSSRRCFDGVWNASLLLELRMMHGVTGTVEPWGQGSLRKAKPHWQQRGWSHSGGFSLDGVECWLYQGLCHDDNAARCALPVPQLWAQGLMKFLPLNMWSCQLFWLASLSEDYCSVCCSDHLAGGMSVGKCHHARLSWCFSVQIEVHL